MMKKFANLEVLPGQVLGSTKKSLFITINVSHSIVISYWKRTRSKRRKQQGGKHHIHITALEELKYYETKYLTDSVFLKIT